MEWDKNVSQRMASRLKQISEVQVKCNRWVVISKYMDGDGYKISVKELKDKTQTYVYLKGSVIIPNKDSLRQLVDCLNYTIENT